MAEALEDVGVVSARKWVVVVRERFGGIWKEGNACARAILWRQGRQTDPNEGSWNSERFMIAGLH